MLNLTSKDIGNGKHCYGTDPDIECIIEDDCELITEETVVNKVTGVRLTLTRQEAVYLKRVIASFSTSCAKKIHAKLDSVDLSSSEVLYQAQSHYAGLGWEDKAYFPDEQKAVKYLDKLYGDLIVHEEEVIPYETHSSNYKD